MRLPCCRERTHRAAMEAPECGNYSCAPGGDARKFDGSLHGLGSTVAEEDMCKSFWHETGKAFKQKSTHIVVDNFWTGDQAQCLRCDSSSNLWSSMSGVRHAVAGGAVDEFVPLVIP